MTTNPEARRRWPDRLYRCRNCGIRIAKNERVMPWKACSEDCADDLWIRAMVKIDAQKDCGRESIDTNQ